MAADGLKGAALLAVGVTAMFAAELTGSKTAKRVEEWVDSKIDEGDET
ncbi:hypothetical protein ABZW11_17275 [Nonomuraea sp. NPDC004580]